MTSFLLYRHVQLVQRFLIPHILSPHYLRHCRVVVSRASFLRLALIQISST